MIDLPPLPVREPEPVKAPIDYFVEYFRLRNDRPRINYRNRAQVSALRKAMDEFERTKRLFNTRKPIDREVFPSIEANLLVLEQQISMMREEFELLRDYSTGLNPLQRILRSNVEQLIKEYGAKISDYSLTVETRPVKIKHNGVLVDLGYYTINIGDRVTISGSKDRRGRCHPHILDGSPCFGSYGAIVQRLKDTGQLYKLYHILIEYLHSYNGESVYANIDEWIHEYCDSCGRLMEKCSCARNEAPLIDDFDEEDIYEDNYDEEDIYEDNYDDEGDDLEEQDGNNDDALPRLVTVTTVPDDHPF